SYYSASIADFLTQSVSSIFGTIVKNSTGSEISAEQKYAWNEEISILKRHLKDFTEGRIIFEYTIPRMGKRVDVILLYRNIVFLLEFKCEDTKDITTTYDQVYDYASDSKNFQKESHNKLIVPIMVPTETQREHNKLIIRDNIVKPLKCNNSNLGVIITEVAKRFDEKDFDYVQWENSEYLPTPTIVEAAQAL